jgi:hypothetical protein
MAKNIPTGIPTTFSFTDEELGKAGKTVTVHAHLKVAKINLKKDDSGKLTMHLLDS